MNSQKEDRNWESSSYSNVVQALALLEAMTAAGGDVSPDVVSYNTCLKACGSAAKLDRAIQVRHSQVSQLQILSANN